MKFVLGILAVIALFVGGSAAVDERVVNYEYAYPVKQFATKDFRRRNDSRWAIDAAAESTWVGSRIEREFLEVTFLTPLAVNGILLDPGNAHRSTVHPEDLRFQFAPDTKPAPPETVAAIVKFFVWRTYKFRPRVTSSVRITCEAVGEGTNLFWSIRNLRFLTRDPYHFDAPEFQRRLPKLVLPACVALAWCALLYAAARWLHRSGEAASSPPPDVKA